MINLMYYKKKRFENDMLKAQLPQQPAGWYFFQRIGLRAVAGMAYSENNPKVFFK